jgi:hypothetical protein
VVAVADDASVKTSAAANPKPRALCPRSISFEIRDLIG